jgi:hypothetical protein
MVQTKYGQTIYVSDPKQEAYSRIREIHSRDRIEASAYAHEDNSVTVVASGMESVTFAPVRGI